MRIKIRGKTWRIEDVRLYGLCTPKTRAIAIQEGQPPKERMDTMIHELLHALDLGLTHKQVCEVAGVLTKALLKDGWHRKK